LSDCPATSATRTTGTPEQSFFPNRSLCTHIWPFTSVGRNAALILGFFLCLLALGLARGKRRAWQLTIVLLPLSALAHLVKGLDVEEAVLTMALWMAVLVSEPFFRVESDRWRARQGVVLLLLGLALLFIYSLAGFYLLHPQFLTSGTVGEVLRSLLGHTLNLPARQLLPLTRRASWFLGSIPSRFLRAPGLAGCHLPGAPGAHRQLS